MHASNFDADLLLEAKREIAITTVRRLLAACQNYEQTPWVLKFQRIEKALEERRFVDAVFEECRSDCEPEVPYGKPKWVQSRELAEHVWRTINSIRYHVHFGDRSPAVTVLEEPLEFEKLGTLQQERERIRARIPPIIHDPIEDDPRYAPLLRYAEELADENLKDHPMRGHLGLIHEYWDEKREILARYGIEWKSPMELNPGVIFFD